MPWIVEQTEPIPGGSRLILVGDALPAMTERAITVPNYGSFTYEWTSTVAASPEVRTNAGVTYPLGSGTSGSGVVALSDNLGGASVLDLMNGAPSDFYIKFEFSYECVESGGSAEQPTPPTDTTVIWRNTNDGRHLHLLEHLREVDQRRYRRLQVQRELRPGHRLPGHQRRDDDEPEHLRHRPAGRKHHP